MLKKKQAVDEDVRAEQAAMDPEAAAAAKKQEVGSVRKPEVIWVGLALLLVLVIGLIQPLWESISLNGWLERAAREAAAIAEELPDVEFIEADYDLMNREIVLYAYMVVEENPIPQRVEVGRVSLPEGADTDTFESIRSLSDGWLFAHKLSAAPGGGTQWDGIYVSATGQIGVLEEYVLRELDDGMWYLGSVPEGLK